MAIWTGRTRACLILGNLFLILLAAGWTTPGDALAQDRVGLFWDPGYTIADGTLATTPGPVTGYVVIKESTVGAGIVGWEMCLEIPERVFLLNTTYNGQAINVLDAPCFVVGLAEPILPTGPDLLLATVEMLVLDSRPLAFSLVPTPNPSLPGFLSYVPADDPGALHILGTTTAQPEVATINNDNPWPEYDTDTLDFGVLATGVRETRTVTVTNSGNTNLLLNPALSTGCDGFLLESVSGVVSLVPGASLTVDVTFAPTEVRAYTCTLNFGPNLPTVSLLGTGREPVFGYTVSGPRNFGEVAIGNWRTLSSIVRNTGEIPFTASPALVACGPRVHDQRRPELRHRGHRRLPRTQGYHLEHWRERHLPVTGAPGLQRPTDHHQRRRKRRPGGQHESPRRCPLPADNNRLQQL